jgi:hypothetical protein
MAASKGGGGGGTGTRDPFFPSAYTLSRCLHSISSRVLSARAILSVVLRFSSSSSSPSSSSSSSLCPSSRRLSAPRAPSVAVDRFHFYLRLIIPATVSWKAGARRGRAGTRRRGRACEESSQPPAPASKRCRPTVPRSRANICTLPGLEGDADARAPPPTPRPRKRRFLEPRGESPGRKLCLITTSARPRFPAPRASAQLFVRVCVSRGRRVGP